MVLLSLLSGKPADKLVKNHLSGIIFFIKNDYYYSAKIKKNKKKTVTINRQHAIFTTLQVENR